MDQFRDFQAFIQKVDKYGMQSGIVKVIPPKEWTGSLPALDEAVKKIRVKNPIMQEFHGSHGTYTQANIERQRSYNLPQWKALCEESSHQPPARRGERRRNQERAPRATPTPRPATTRSSEPQQKRGPGRPPKRSNQQQQQQQQQVKIKEEPPADDGLVDKTKPEGPPTPVSPESNPVEAKSEELSEGESLPAPKPKGRQPRSVTARRKTNNRGDAIDAIDEEAFKGFDYHITDGEDYTAERCEELETAYWKSLMFNNPLYGADMPGSLFDDSTTSWNVARLPNLLDVLGQKVPGVNTAYLYLGMWKATFAWHLEDVDLYSINYIHFGAPKQWYSISQADAPRFEQAMRSIWPSDAKNCDQFLRHKTYLVSPSILKSQYGITVNRLVHYEGEFVITYPYGYHSGFNLGYNCAESVNFATEQWLDYGRIAKKCHCEADSVWIDVEEIQRKLRGESTPEYYYYGELESELDEMDGASDLLTPPRSVPEKAGSSSSTITTTTTTTTTGGSTRGRKRKLDNGEPRTGKRTRMGPDASRKLPCVLCPNNLDYEDLLPTEDGKAHAHRRCALYIEETTILRDGTGREVVCDIDQIPKARLGLKCLFCREVRGACFQCNFGKCTRAYHATCALLAGVQVEMGSLAVVADDGQTYSVPSVDLKCKFHRQKRQAWYPGETADTDKRLIERASRLIQGDLVQFQADKEINGAIVLQNRPEERTALLKVLPRGDIIELPYRWMLIVRRSNFPPLPSGIAPLPAHLARKPDPRRDLDTGLPLPGRPFCDADAPYQWAEFESVALRASSDAAPPVLVDLDRHEQLWHYLGASSTECRAQYTHNPSLPVHNPRANFLDSVKSLGALAAAGRLPPSSSSSSSLSSSHPHHHLYAAVTAAAAAPPSSLPLQQRPPPSAAAAAMPPAYHRSLPNNRNNNSLHHSHHHHHRHAPYPSVSVAKTLPPHHHLTTTTTTTTNNNNNNNNNNHNNNNTTTGGNNGVNNGIGGGSDLPTHTFANVRELIARRRLAQITEHANVFAGYPIISPEQVVEILLGPMGSVPPPTGLEKLELAMAQRRVQPRAADGTLLPLQPLNMRSEEVTRLLQMLRFSLVSHRERLDVLHKRDAARPETTVDKAAITAAKLPGKYAYLDQQRTQVPTVYQSPYDMPSGFSAYAQQTYGLVPAPPAPDRPVLPSLANDFFARLTPDQQELILRTCGSFVQQRATSSRHHSRQGSSSSNLRLSAALARQTDHPIIDITPAAAATGGGPTIILDADGSDVHPSLRPNDDGSDGHHLNHHHHHHPQHPQHPQHHPHLHHPHLSTHHLSSHHHLSLAALDPPLHADSPTSSFSRSHLRFPSPNHDFVPHADSQDHHDLFGDQQANTRFWQHGPWAAGDGNTPNEENRPFFGPHERLKHDYASSDISLGRGPGSLHSVDMAGFGLDVPDDLCADLSP
ncbi:hypothetical protein ASPZODRAFT_1046496 [Penicilliopsis zonata CBS 506.65]|uniref:[histone H3]-trimethyl-L-lysine(9) demethylase n=1 Tax=Penicilliopsis zonata CBS 506.65 TaxID=1073090 RepID=A0A1L9SRV4_9EURO|nr:hypothetical protein ASPZODRAFT_1046496 [Penicilliopsis zonata CBS 506.65]OJJ49854.1 hypothetical protein ASPZODRAFT_1046496 [Penicilliopsis zonata CBS 506.65]